MPRRELFRSLKFKSEEKKKVLIRKFAEKKSEGKNNPRDYSETLELKMCVMIFESLSTSDDSELMWHFKQTFQALAESWFVTLTQTCEWKKSSKERGKCWKFDVQTMRWKEFHISLNSFNSIQPHTIKALIKETALFGQLLNSCTRADDENDF